MSDHRWALASATAATIAVAGVILQAASPELIEHLTKWESGGKRVLVVYADKLAGGTPTVCNGLTNAVTKTPIIVGQRWSEEACVAEERAAVLKVQAKLATCFRQPPPQSVFDMATSHAWNFGVSATCGSGAMAAWNRGDWKTGCARIARGDDGRLVWSYVCTSRGCLLIQGLANRRADEAGICWPDFSNVIAGVVTTRIRDGPSSTMGILQPTDFDPISEFRHREFTNLSSSMKRNSIEGFHGLIDRDRFAP